jgi:di/tricarboxylate transporter
MSPDAAIVFGILGVAGILFASGRVRLDITALLVVLALMLSGVLTPREALRGFGDPVVPLVAGLLVVGEMLSRTGVSYAIGRWLMRVGGTSETRLLILLMLAAGLLGSVMSSTAVVAVFIPVVLTISAKTDLNASRLLMPLSFAALVSGMMTLIATTPNLVVSAELADKGHEPFGFFSFTPIGLAVLSVTVAYMWLVGRHLLPGGGVAPAKSDARTLEDLWAGFGLESHRHRLRVTRPSPLAGLTLAQTEIGTRFDARVIGIERRARRGGRNFFPSPSTDAEVHEGDVLCVVAEPADAAALADQNDLEPLAIGNDDRELWKAELGLAVVILPPESRLMGRTLRESEFRSSHALHVMGLRRGNAIVPGFADEPLHPGDSLLVLGSWHSIARLQSEGRDFLVLTLPEELDEVAPARQRAPIALMILAGMVLLAAFDVVPVVTAVLLAALAAVLSGCLSMEDGYSAISWSSLVLIAGMLPVADALEMTGGVDLIVEALGDGLGDAGPYLLMSVFFVLTAGLGMVLSNTATAVLVAPIAMRAATLLDVSPYPLAMTVAIAASAAFVTPVSSPVVTLVVAPGSYGFLDFVKVGLPLLVLTWATTLLVTPIFFPTEDRSV